MSATSTRESANCKHFLYLIAGNVLTLDTDGETALIPSQIIHHSIEQKSSVHVEASLRVMASPGQPTMDVPGYESSDQVIRLVGNVFRLAEVEKRAVEAGKYTCLLSSSPFTISSLDVALQASHPY